MLFVGQDPEWRERLRETLRVWGFGAGFAWSYPEALARAGRVQPKVVLVALDQLEGGSVRFASALRGLLPETGIALVTASRVSATSLRLRAAGVAEVFERPLQWPALAEWLAEQLAPR